MSVASPKEIFDLTGRVAIVTGGGTGIGRATALLLAACGAHVVLAARGVDRLERVAAEVNDAGGSATVVPTDVRDAAACRHLVDRSVEECGRLDVLVNNAGGSRARTSGDWAFDDWRAMIDLNLTSVWVLARAVAPHMITVGGGAIVNVSSAASFRANPTHAPYGTAKAGVNHLTAMLAAELAPHNIRVNCVAVGLVRSEGFVRAMVRLGRDPDERASEVALGRLGEPVEIAHPILFLVSKGASYISGETIYIGGGPRS